MIIKKYLFLGVGNFKSTSRVNSTFTPPPSPFSSVLCLGVLEAVKGKIGNVKIPTAA